MVVEITDVTLRDGLQDEPLTLTPWARAEIAGALVAASVPRLEVASFVSTARVPQMAGAEELITLLPQAPSVTYTALSLNLRGAERAAETTLGELNVVVSASERHSVENAGRSSAQAVAEIAQVVQRFGARMKISAGVATAFSSPFEPDGRVPEATVIQLVASLVDLGLTRIALADTMGTAAPEHVEAIMRRVLSEFPEVTFMLHLHDAEGQALETVGRAVELGIRHFDSALAGLGGCPFAPGAHGNLATERLVGYLHRQGIQTGIDEDLLQAAVLKLREQLQLGSPLPASLP